MSLGDTYNNNKTFNRNKYNDNFSVYSPYRMNNPSSKTDATCITFRFWRNNLCVGIFPRKNTGNDEISFDMDNGITIYLSHTKARILKNEIELFMKDPDNYSGSGVYSGESVITISNGIEYGKDNPLIIIRKVRNGNLEDVSASFAYEFHRDFHYSIRNYEGKTYNEVYDEYNNIEIEQFITLLDEFCKASTAAIAFSVMDQHKYSTSRIENKIDTIANGLGIEIKGNTNSNRRFENVSNLKNSGESYSNNTTYQVGTIDDLE